jgi:hypothetical protein
MKVASSESWRFEESVDRLPHLALFVRDALRLTVSPQPTVPPRLSGDIPDLSDRLDETVRRDAAADWVQWWEAITGLAGVTGAPPDAPVARGRERAVTLMQYIDPPEWNSLTEHPALRQAVLATHDDADDFADKVRRSVIRPDRPPSVFPYPVVRDAAENVAAAEGVRLSLLSASATIIFVSGPWWTLVRAGELLCSDETARISDHAYEALTTAFRSGLA